MSVHALSDDVEASGTASLVAGAATVADTKITANSVIRVHKLTPGGTSGAVFLNTKTASTGFTIGSTSATDTGVVSYEVLSY